MDLPHPMWTNPTSHCSSLIVDQNNVDKGLASRFLWIFPKPVINNFASLNINQNAECESDAVQFKELIGKTAFFLSST